MTLASEDSQAGAPILGTRTGAKIYRQRNQPWHCLHLNPKILVRKTSPFLAFLAILLSSNCTLLTKIKTTRAAFE